MKEIHFSARRFAFVLLAAGLLTFSAAAGRCLNSPLRFDETDFAAQARAIVRHGVPKISYAEDRLIHVRPYFGYDAHYGMWHPALYLYSLAAGLKIWGDGGHWTFRLTGLLWFMASAALALRMMGGLVEKERRGTARIFLAGLILLCPLLTDGSLFIDIDNTSLNFSLLLFMAAYFRYENETSPKALGILGLAFAFALLSKLTTPFFLLPVIVIYQTLKGNLRRGLVQAAGAAAMGTVLFAAAYWIYCRAANYPAHFMFDVMAGKTGMIGLLQSFKRMMHSFHWHFVWISPPVFLILAVLTARRFRAYLSGEKPGKTDFLILFSAVNACVYIVLGGLFGKYLFPAVFAGLMAFAALEGASFSFFRIRRYLIGMGLFLLALHVFMVPPLQERFPSLQVHASGWAALLWNERTRGLLISLAGFAALFFFGKRSAGISGASQFTFFLLIYLLAANPAGALKAAFSSDDRSPYRIVQERGFEETAGFLNAEAKNGQTLLAPKDLGFYYKGRYYFSDDPEAQSAGTAADFAADSEKFPLLEPAVLAAGNFKPFKKTGDFMIYKKGSSA